METILSLQDIIPKVKDLLQSGPTVSSSELFRLYYQQDTEYNRIIPAPSYDNWFFYTARPTGVKQAKILDFIRINIYHKDGYELRIGYPYIMIHSQELFYYLMFVNEYLVDTKILPYILKGQVLIFT